MIDQIIHTKAVPYEEFSIARNEYLIQQGQKERYFYYVIDGALRAYTIIEDEEYTIRFAYKNSIVAALPAYFTDAPSDISIQAIRKSKLIRFKKADFESFLESSTENLKTYNALLKDLVSSFYEREVDLLTTSPSERLKRILKRSPQVFQEIPHKYIASYLRMSPETLSRLLNS